jgi:hypothetical protein
MRRDAKIGGTRSRKAYGFAGKALSGRRNRNRQAGSTSIGPEPTCFHHCGVNTVEDGRRLFDYVPERICACTDMYSTGTPLLMTC